MAWRCPEVLLEIDDFFSRARALNGDAVARMTVGMNPFIVKNAKLNTISRIITNK